MNLEKIVQEAGRLTRNRQIRAPRIVVVGTGGAGCNTIDTLSRRGSLETMLVAVNTDAPHLETIEADHKLLLGERITHGMGAGGDPLVGENCALESELEIRDIITGNDIVFITAGLGGGTGTGSAPVIAEIGRRAGAIVVAIVSTPFAYEGEGRMRKAMKGLERLRENSDGTIVMDNNRLNDMAPNLSISKAFMAMDLVISRVIKGVIDAISTPTLINIDLSDFRNIMKLGGVSTVLYAENSDPERLVSEALSNPFLNIDYSGARGALINVVGGPKMNLRMLNKISTAITKQLDPRANIIIGTGVDANLGSEMHLLAILTGIESKEIEVKQAAPSQRKMAGIDIDPIAGMVR